MRSDQKQRKSAAAPARNAPRARRFGRFGWITSPFLLGAVGAAIVALLVGYLITQASASSDGHSSGDHAALNDSPDLPGTFVPAQGGSHLGYSFTMSHTPVPYCEGVEWSGAGSTPEPTQTPTNTATPAATVTGTPTVREDCYLTNPPSSGPMLGGQRAADVGNGVRMTLPPDPDVYPRDVDIPREGITHTLEHAGVFVAYNCAQDDQACWDVVSDLEDLVNKRIDNYDNRVVMGYFSDLPQGQIGLSAWTRVDRFPYQEYDRKRAEQFIAAHSCRYDEEGIC
jgi:hypothetical protein